MTGTFDIASPEIYGTTGIPHATFARMRAEAPVYRHAWHEGDFWAVTRYEDCQAVTRDWRTYSSEQGMTNLWDLDEEAKAARKSLIDTDPPAHVRLRRLVTPPFTLRKSVDYTEATRSIAAELLDALESRVDVLPALAAPLPIRVIVSILGVPTTDTDFMVELSDYLVEGTGDHALDPHAFGNTTPLHLLPFNSPAAFALFDYGRKLGAERRQCPADDLVSKLINATDADGDRLTDQEFCNFFQLLVFAGNETTRTAIAQGLLAFMQHPDQQERLHADPSLIPSAVEEIIRWASPVVHMRRTATCDTELNGVQIAAGDKVVIWYASANFDGEVFEDPMRFDIGRSAKPDLGSFGFFGPHHCLGAPLARLEIRILLEEIVRRGLRFELDGDPVRVRSNFVHGLISVPARVTS